MSGKTTDLNMAPVRVENEWNKGQVNPKNKYIEQWIAASNNISKRMCERGYNSMEEEMSDEEIILNRHSQVSAKRLHSRSDFQRQILDNEWKRSYYKKCYASASNHNPKRRGIEKMSFESKKSGIIRAGNAKHGEETEHRSSQWSLADSNSTVNERMVVSARSMTMAIETCNHEDNPSTAEEEERGVIVSAPASVSSDKVKTQPKEGNSATADEDVEEVADADVENRQKGRTMMTTRKRKSLRLNASKN